MPDRTYGEPEQARKRFVAALSRGDSQAVRAMAGAVPASLLTEWKSDALKRMTKHYLSGIMPFCVLTAAAQAASVLYDGAAPAVACCGAVRGNTCAAGRDYIMMLLTAWGVPVLDLGTDVSPEGFISALREHSLRFAVCAVFSDQDARWVRRIHDTAAAEGIRDTFRLAVCGADMSGDLLKSTGADCGSTGAAAVAQWVVNTWRS